MATTGAETALSSADATKSHWISRSLEAVLDLVFPPRCVACSAEIEPPTQGPLFCPACDSRLSLNEQAACLVCASPCSEVDLARGDCFRCRGRKMLFQAARTMGPYDDRLREAVLQAKHAEYEPLAAALGERLAQRIRQSPFAEPPELIVAVPMHWLKRIWRRTNPAETVAQAAAKRLGVTYAKNALVCRRILRRQATLTPEDRRRNVRGAFRASRLAKLAGKRILLVDDVMTTGATAHECSRALLTAGAASVVVATVARRVPE